MLYLQIHPETLIMVFKERSTIASKFMEKITLQLEAELDMLREQAYSARKSATDWAGDVKTMLFFQGKEKAYTDMISRMESLLSSLRVSA